VHPVATGASQRLAPVHLRLQAASLKEAFTARLQLPEHYTQLREPLSYCLETRHLSAHQPHLVTVGRVLQLLAHSRSIVLVMQQAVLHAEPPPEEEDDAVAEFLQVRRGGSGWLRSSAVVTIFEPDHDTIHVRRWHSIQAPCRAFSWRACRHL
jgi:hypothetical protein